MSVKEAFAAATAPEVEPEADAPPDAEAVARELAKVSPLEYDRKRQAEADRLGVRVTTLDSEVARHRGQPADHEAGQMFPADDPWPEPVDGGELLDSLCATYDRFVRFSSPEARDATAIWTLLAHAHDAAMISPILAIESPEKRCGKTTLLSAVALLVPRALPVVNCSHSVIFRAIEKYLPTILIDEGDTILRDNDDLRGILNGGHNRLTAFVLRNVDVGGDYEPRRFNVWAPKVIALIGDLPDTLQDRSIVIHMRRKLPNDSVERFRADRVIWADDLRRKTARWASDNLSRLKDADPNIPAKLHDRAADNWRTMLAIADLCGWGERARRAAMVLSGAADGDDENPAVMLLADCREIFGVDRDLAPHRSTISPRELAEQLIVLEGRPWSDWRAGKPISDRSVGRLLAPFGIKSRRGHKSRLFHRTDFDDAWKRLDWPPFDRTVRRFPLRP